MADPIDIIKAGDELLPVADDAAKAVGGWLSGLFGKGKSAAGSAKAAAGSAAGKVKTKVKTGAKIGLPVMAGASVLNQIPGVKNVIPDFLTLGGATNALFGGNQPQTGTQIDYSKIGVSPGNRIEDDPYYKALAAIAGGKTGGGGGGGSRGTDMNPYYNRLTEMANQSGAASLAAMQNLANQAAGVSTGISAGGEASSEALRRIYGDAATQITEASKAAGTEGSSLTPVSGVMAMLPEQVRQAGGTMADYLKANQLISAQDAAYLGQLANLQGTGYATQFGRQDEVFRMADQARRQAEARRAAAAAASRNASAQQEALLTMAKLQSEYNRNNPSGLTVGGTSNISGYVSEWDKASKDKNQSAYLRSIGITTPEQYINARLREQAQLLNQIG
jgi:hypothetical protein